MSENYCDFGKHHIDILNDYVIYTDQERGLFDVKMCKHCYAIHILKYFPESHMAMFLKNNPTQYHLSLEERGFFEKKNYKQPTLLSNLQINDNKNDCTCSSTESKVSNQ